MADEAENLHATYEKSETLRTMSRASCQSLLLLGLVEAVFITIKDYNLTPDLLPTIEYGHSVSTECLSKFPELGNPKKNLDRISEMMVRVDRLLNHEEKSIYNAATLGYIAQHILQDLMEKIMDRRKLELMEPVLEAVEGFLDFIDPDRDMFESMEHVNHLVSEVYKRIGFVL